MRRALGVMGVVALWLGAGARAGAEEAAARTVGGGGGATTAAAVAAPPPRARAGSFLRETGRVAEIKVGRAPGDLQALPVEPQDQRHRDVPVRVYASQAESSKAVRGQINRGLVEMEAEPYLRALRVCPLEVARKKQVPLGAIDAGHVELAFTIQPSGAVTEARAFASRGADDAVLACVGRRMFAWRFTPPDGGPAEVHMRVKLQGARVVLARP
jgi:hypothetical protein